MANEEHVKILRQGFEVWNKWRKDNPMAKPDLSWADLSGADLSGANLKQVNLSGANLKQANLSGANLNYAKLYQANLQNAKLLRAKLCGANLNRANLQKADLSRAQLDNAKLNQANLREADLSYMKLANVNLSEANLSNANLVGASLAMADLSNANLSGAKLDNVKLIMTNLSGANLSGANLSRVDLSWTKLNLANLSEANFRGAVFIPEGEPNGTVSFLDLSTCIGIESAKFSEPDFLINYLAKAFEYAHKPDNYEAKFWPVYLKGAIDKIRLLRSLYPDQDPPKQVIEVIGVISDELIKYLKKHPDAMHQIKPRQFEELVAEILASYGWRVQLTPPTKDGGYDIFAISKDVAGVETSWIIECKKYAAENKVGVDIARALYGVRSRMQVANIMLATTSYFTKGVKDLKASSYDLELKDYEGILEWINEYRPNPDGKLYIKNNRLILPGE